MKLRNLFGKAISKIGEGLLGLGEDLLNVENSALPTVHQRRRARRKIKKSVKEREKKQAPAPKKKPKLRERIFKRKKLTTTTTTPTPPPPPDKNVRGDLVLLRGTWAIVETGKTILTTHDKKIAEAKYEEYSTSGAKMWIALTFHKKTKMYQMWIVRDTDKLRKRQKSRIRRAQREWEIDPSEWDNE